MFWKKPFKTFEWGIILWKFFLKKKKIVNFQRMQFFKEFPYGLAQIASNSYGNWIPEKKSLISWIYNINKKEWVGIFIGEMLPSAIWQ